MRMSSCCHWTGIRKTQVRNLDLRLFPFVETRSDNSSPTNSNSKAQWDPLEVGRTEDFVTLPECKVAKVTKRRIWSRAEFPKTFEGRSAGNLRLTKRGSTAYFAMVDPFCISFAHDIDLSLRLVSKHILFINLLQMNLYVVRVLKYK